MSTGTPNPFETDERRALRSMAYDFAREQVVPNLAQWESDGRLPRELHVKAAAAGLLGLGFPESMGGSGGDDVDVAVMTEAFMAAGASGGLLSALFTHGIALPHLVRGGTAEQQEQFVRPVLAGQAIASLAVTEPGGGSDVARLTTRADLDGSHYVVNGAKTFITSGTRADFVVAAVRTGEAGAAGLSMLVVETDREGFWRSAPLQKLGWRCSDTAELSFTNVRVPTGNLIGAPGQAFELLAQAFAIERLWLAIIGYSTADRALTLAREWAAQRETFGRPLSQRQVVRHTLVEMQRQVTVAREFTRSVVVRSAAGENVMLDALLAKKTTTDACTYVVDRALQLFGGTGFMTGTEVERHYRDSRILAIGGGAEEVMTDLAATLMGL